MKTILLTIFLGLAFLAPAQETPSTESTEAVPEKPAEPIEAVPEKPTEITDVNILIRTSAGDLRATLFATQTPMTTLNMVNLIEHQFFNGTKFHRAIPGTMIHAGDPQSRDEEKSDRWGTGNPGYTFKNEIIAELKHDETGTLSMMNSGPDTNGCQFFITLKELAHLDGKYTVFGRILDTDFHLLKQIKRGDTIEGIDVLTDISILKATYPKTLKKWNTVLSKTTAPNEN